MKYTKYSNNAIIYCAVITVVKTLFAVIQHVPY